MGEQPKEPAYMWLQVHDVSMGEDGAFWSATIACSLWNDSGHPVLFRWATCKIFNKDDYLVARAGEDGPRNETTITHLTAVPPCECVPLGFTVPFQGNQGRPASAAGRTALVLSIIVAWRYKGVNGHIERRVHYSLADRRITHVTDADGNDVPDPAAPPN